MARARRQPVVIAFDLEMNQPSNRIIQIGAAAGDLDTGRVLDTFTQLVDPGEPLAAAIAKLTGIAPAALPLAPPLAEAFGRFVRWAEPFRAVRKPHLLTWGVWDHPVLREQVGAHPAGWPFGQRWLDVKAVYQAWRHAHGHTGQGGLDGAVLKLGGTFEGRAHDAQADAVNTFLAYAALLGKFADRPPVIDADVGTDADSRGSRPDRDDVVRSLAP